MDISTLTNLITAFRAETRTDAITPDTLGSLLQRIVNVLEDVGEDSIVQQILQWKTMVTGIGSVLKSISLGSDDRNNLTLNIGSVNMSTGRGQAIIFTLRPATTAKAGVMTAQHVTDINDLKENMNHVAALELKTKASATDVDVTLYDRSGELFNDTTKLVVTLPVASSIQAGVITANDYKKLGNSNKPFYHIECDAKNSKLVVKYPAQLIADGYIPYLLRYSKKRPRYRNKLQPHRRWYGPLMRGWHLYQDEKKIKMSQIGEVQFGRNVGTDKNPVWEYSEDMRYLFGDIRPIYRGNPPYREICAYKVPFGCHAYKVEDSHRFRFGIVFGPPLPASGNRSLDFSKCVSNIAEFFVNFRKTYQEGDDGEFFMITYSI